MKTWVNGAFTFSPDGNPLVGPVPGKRGYWCACAVMAGFPAGRRRGQVAGRMDDPWRTRGRRLRHGCRPLWGFRRKHPNISNETTGQFYSRRFVMTYPNEQLPAGRPLKTAPAHDAMTAGRRPSGGTSWDLEVATVFRAERAFVETPTLKRSNAFPIVAEECKDRARRPSA